MFRTSVTIRQTVALVSADAATLTLLDPQFVDPEQMRALMDGLLKHIALADRRQASLAGESVGATVETRVRLDIATGLPFLAESNRSLGAKKTPRKRLVIECPTRPGILIPVKKPAHLLDFRQHFRQMAANRAAREGGALAFQMKGPTP